MIIENADGTKSTPSVVCFAKGKKYTDESQQLIGQVAVNQGPRNAENTIYDAKRMIGALFDDPAIQKDLRRWPFEVVKGRLDRPAIVI